MAQARPHINRKLYGQIFAWLSVLTALEVGIVLVHGIPRPLLVTALIGMALAKALLVAQFFMHLKYDAPRLRATIFGCMAMPVFYAVILISEAAWRLT